MMDDGLIFKPEQNGIPGNLLRFYLNYLSTRKQQVFGDDTMLFFHSKESWNAFKWPESWPWCHSSVGASMEIII